MLTCSMVCRGTLPADPWSNAALLTPSTCRSGNPLLTADLARVSADRARSIIVLANPGEPAQSDARTLRTTLSLMGLHDSRIRAGLPGLAVSRALLAVPCSSNARHWKALCVVRERVSARL